MNFYGWKIKIWKFNADNIKEKANRCKHGKINGGTSTRCGKFSLITHLRWNIDY